MADRAYAIYINMSGLPAKHNANLYIPIINKTKHLINKPKHLINKPENLINKEEHPPHSSAVLRQHSRPGHSIHVPDEERHHQIFHI